MRKYRLWLLLIILIGLALRLFWLGQQSLWYDEGVTWMLSQMNQLSDLVQWTAADIQPPLYYLLIWTTDIIFGHSEWALRFPSVLFGMLTIPLLAVLARRLFWRRRTALLAAALLAVSPLMVYYSQEVRMYTLLVFEGTLATFLLLKILHPTGAAVPRGLRPTRQTLFYLLATAAALYTHYFAAFLLAVHAVYAAFIWWRRPSNRRLFGQWLWGFGGALLLFAPWLPIVLARLGDDPSYWPGALKLSEAVRKLLITFTAGETVFEQTGWWLALAYLALLLLGGLWVLFNRPTGRRANRPAASRPAPYFLLLVWLLLPPALILALSYQSPKFNPRYTLLSWPAFTLIVAGTLSRLWPPAFRQTRWRRYASGGLLAVFGLVIAGVSAFSLFNWYADPRFSKDDFKALAQFVRERIAPDETVLLSSGHMFPVWAYYYGWDGWTPLPWMLRLDVNRVTDLSIAKQIEAAVQGKSGVWLVTWQDDVIDPNGVVPFWLDRLGERPHDAGDFWGVGLEHWRLDPDKIERLTQNPIDRPLDINFNNQIELLGMTQLSDTELVLFWRPRQVLPDNLVLTLKLKDRNDFTWSQETTVSRPGNYVYPPSRWPVGSTVITRHTLNWLTGTPPGLYLAQVGLGTASGSGQFAAWDVLDATGRPQRRTALVDFVNLSHLVEPEYGQLPQDTTPLADLFPIIGLRRSILPEKSAQPGDRILLALLWQAGQYNLDDVSVAFDLIDSAGQTFRVGSSYTPSRRFNLPRWQPHDVVLGQYWLDIPSEAAPGPATLQLHIINVGAWTYDETFQFDRLDILPTERNFSPPESLDFPLDADFSGQATLLGVDCPNRCAAAPGQSLDLRLYWRAEASFDASYTVFTHLLGPNETVLVNADHTPPKPTTGWVPGEIITDPVTLNLPTDLPPGDYTAEIGLYNATDPTFARLPLASGDNRVQLPNSLHVK